jgi:hypothetical protein
MTASTGEQPCSANQTTALRNVAAALMAFSAPCSSQ